MQLAHITFEELSALQIFQFLPAQDLPKPDAEKKKDLQEVFKSVGFELIIRCFAKK